MEKKLPPFRLHGVLPWLYVTAGLLTLFAVEGWIAYPAGLLLISAGASEWLRRQRMRPSGADSQPIDTPKVSKTGTPDSESHLVQIRWRSSFDCGHPVIDEQHRELFTIGNRLINAVLSRKPKVDIESLLRELVEHIRHHFATEEAVLARTRYPLTEEHQAIHRLLLTRARELEDQYHVGLVAVSDLVEFIAYDVISAHIVAEDLKFALKKR